MADAPRVHRQRVRPRGHPCSDSGVGADVEVVVVVVVGAADAEAVVVEEVKHVGSPASADEQLGRRMEATEGGRLDEGVQRLGGRQGRRLTRRNGVRGTR